MNIIDNRGNPIKQTTFRDLKPGDWFTFTTSNSKGHVWMRDPHRGAVCMVPNVNVSGGKTYVVGTVISRCFPEMTVKRVKATIQLDDY